MADRSAAYVPESDPLHDAIAVLSRIDLATLSAHPETEDAGNRVAIALGYLREATKAQSEPRLTPWERLFALLRGDTDV